MTEIERKFDQRLQSSGRQSVLDGPEHICGLPTDTRSSVEEARQHPEETKACKSVLDGPACISGLPH